MKKEYLDINKEKHSWFFDDSKMNLVVTDDLDSLLSSLLLLQYRPDKYKIGYFYSFNDGLYKKKGIDESLPMFGVDLSHPGEMRCISNHVTRLNEQDSINPNDINLNNIDNVSLQSYHSKYNLNTLVLVYSLLGLQPSTKLEKVLLLLPDSSFLPFYAPNKFLDKHIQKKYLCEVLELPEVWEVQQELTKNQFFRSQDVLNIKSKLWVTDKGIEPKDNVDLELLCKYLNIDTKHLLELQGDFFMEEIHNSYVGSTSRKYKKEDYYSFAITSKYQCKYSKRVDIAH